MTTTNAGLSRRRFLALGSAAAGGALAVGCSPASSTNTPAAAPGTGSAAKGTVTVMSQSGEFGPKEAKAAGQALGVTVKTVEYDLTKLTAMLASGNPPDVVRGMGALDTPYLVARQVAENLDPYFAKSTLIKADDIDPVNDLWRFDGEKQGSGPRYGFAKDYSQDCTIWFNSALFDQAKVTHPSATTPLLLDELLDEGKRLVKRQGAKVSVYGLNPNGLGLFTQLSWLTDLAGGKLTSDDLASVDFSSSEAQRALTWYLDYAKAGIGPTVLNPDPNGWDGPTFQAGRMAATLSGYWLGGLFAGDPKSAKVAGFAPAPQFDTGRRISPCFGATGLWIPKASKNKDAAWAVLEWFMAGDPAKARAAGGWGIPPLKSLQKLMPQKLPYQKQAYEVQMAEQQHFSVTSVTPYVRQDAINAVITRELPKAIKGSMSAGQFADTLNSQINAQLADGKKRLR
ncbi:multiple sugar transport system substrate-binding protein [Kribbella pratensis]|uniref:Multiple sugar transport system substrate-binding protein n=1 Tax=Kribbella pratensis TaxID=2512112 RepID=A0ABY2FHS0_9ACTN|nr:extracellular solute-binding protein [Kribbella pratensis]TDW90747.1 multiple sugar transport system substrate-binding protein [Kribbella pratensis]